MLPYDEIEMWHGHPNLYMNTLEDVLNTEDDSDIGCFVEVDLNYPDYIEKNTKNFPFAPENKIVNPDKFTPFLNRMKTNTSTRTKKIIFGWTDKKKCLIHHKLLYFYV